MYRIFVFWLSGRAGIVSSGQGDREVERRPLVLPALRPDAAAVQLHELLADGEPKPGAAGATDHRIVELLERLEQPGQVVLTDADPGVGDAHPDDIRLGHHADEHPALACKLDRVG